MTAAHESETQAALRKEALRLKRDSARMLDSVARSIATAAAKNDHVVISLMRKVADEHGCRAWFERAVRLGRRQTGGQPPRCPSVSQRVRRPQARANLRARRPARRVTRSSSASGGDPHPVQPAGRGLTYTPTCRRPR